MNASVNRSAPLTPAQGDGISASRAARASHRVAEGSMGPTGAGIPTGGNGAGAAHFATGPSVSACPACDAAPAALAVAGGAEAPSRLMFSVPSAHCADCMVTMERGLERMEGVTSARVNLTLRRISVEAEASVTPDAIVARLGDLGYEAHELDPGLLSMTETDKRGRDLLMRLGVAGFSMMNIMLLSVAVWSGAEGMTRDMFHWVSAAIALPTVAFSGQPFFKSAWAGLKAGRLGMDFPISLAIVLASSISLYETINHGHHAYFDAAVMLTFFLLAGRYLDYRTRAIARSAAEELAALEVPRASRLMEGGEETVPVADLRPGDLIRVRPGGRMPADGVVTSGASEVDRSLITGESLPAWAGEGSAVATGEVNLTGPLTVRVTAAGRDSSLHRMAELVAVAESARNRYTSLADRAARAYSPLVHIVAFSSFLWWMSQTGGDWRVAINIAAAVLIITCPCALGLAVPAVVTAASGRLFRMGLLIKNGTALERLAGVDTVVFDKTGTLTLGAPEPVNLAEIGGREKSVALALAQGSAHPLAEALRLALLAEGVVAAEVDDIHEVPGYGVEGIFGGDRVRFGRATWVGAETAALTGSHLQIGAAPPVSFTFADRLRPGAAEVVRALLARGMTVKLVSGDVSPAVAALAERVGISDWVAEALPEEKASLVRDLSQCGRHVLMVGDGLNDTAALAAADVSVSPASALDAARVASDIVLLGQDLAPIADAIRVARRSRSRIEENFAISFGYNLVAVPLAIIGLATPLAAALAMSISSITVSINALRVR